MMFMLPQPNDGFEWVQASAGLALVCRPLEAVSPHLFTTRPWRLGSRAAADAEGWAEVASAMQVVPGRLVHAHQVHGNSVHVRRAAETAPQQPPAATPEADIIITDDGQTAVAVQTADCVPILIADRRTGVAAAAHAGWRGLALGVPRAAVAALTREFGSRPEDLIAAAGPSISAPRYEVGEDVRERFEARGAQPGELARWFSPSDRSAHWYFDGWRVVRDDLEKAGVPSGQIHVASLCTATYPDLFCSFRRDGSPAGRMAAGIKPPSTPLRAGSPPRPSPHSPADPHAR
jgi:purine-nucleoside/S-methyl-5'-thioadenosine phosphorylase / adenosine deaminase